MRSDPWILCVLGGIAWWQGFFFLGAVAITMAGFLLVHSLHHGG